MLDLINNKYVMWIFKIGITIVFIIVINHSITLDELKVIYNHLTVRHLSLALSFSLIGLYFQVKRWEIILRYHQFPLNNQIAWKTILWGNLLAFITPGRFGEIFRGIRITDKRKGDSLFAVVMDKLFIIVTILLFAFFALLIQMHFLNKSIAEEMKLFFYIAPFLCLIGLILLLTKRNSKRKAKLVIVFDRIFKHLPRLFTPAGRKATLYSFLAHICLLGQSVTLLLMFNCGTVFVNTIAVAQAYGIMLFLPLSIGNMGVREGSFSFCLTHLGAIGNNQIIAIDGASLGTSIIILLMNVIIPALTGLLWYLMDNQYFSKRDFD